MSSLSYPPLTLKTGFGCLMSLMMISTGLTNIFSPSSSSPAFGLPVNASSPAARYHQLMGARNLTLGVIMGVFTARGQVNSLATVLYCLTINGVVDGWITWLNGDGARAWGHWIPTALIPLAGWWLNS